MSRTRIEDLSSDENELFDLSEEQMLIGVAGGFFSGLIDSAVKWATDKDNGAVETIVKSFAIMPVIVGSLPGAVAESIID